MADIHPFHCKAGGCRFPKSHMTIKHRCGNCGETGHGILECGRWARLHDIATIRTTEMASCPQVLVCQVGGCTDPNTHSTSAHHCPNCNIRHGIEGHTCIFHEQRTGDPPRVVNKCIQELPENILDVFEDGYTRYVETIGLDDSIRFVIRPADRIWRFSNSIDTLSPETLRWIRGKSLVFTYFEQPEPPPPPRPPTHTHIYVSPSPSHSPPGDFDISYHDYVSSDEGEADAPTECPVCRTSVSRCGGVIPLYGLDVKDKCSVCLENPVDMVFVACGHAVICSECAKRWQD